MSNIKKESINVRDWIILSTTMIGVILTILALIWQARPASGIVSVTFLLMLAFILFVNSVTTNSKANYESKLDNVSPKRVDRFVAYAEYSFGLGFTFVIVGVAILAYKYLLDFTNRNIMALFLPIIFLLTAWIIILIYNVINFSGKPFKSLRSLKRNIWILMEAGVLFLIYLDFIRMITIP